MSILIEDPNNPTTCAKCSANLPLDEDERVRNKNCEHIFCLDCGSSLRKCPQCHKPLRIAYTAIGGVEHDTISNTISNAAPPPLDPSFVFIPAPPTHFLTANQTELQHFSYTCPGIHGPGSHTNVQRMSFEQFFNPLSSMHVIIPLFQRSYCWSTTTTVPAWWRDTNKPVHSCGKLLFKAHEGGVWCLDGQQRVTTTMLLMASARDALLRLQHNNPDSLLLLQPSLSSALAKLEALLFVDIPAAHSFAASRTPIEEGQRLLFSRLIPSYFDRCPFFELIVGGLVANGTDDWLSEATRSSIQYNTKHYFDEQFQHMLDSNTPAAALEAVASRATSAVNMQMMMIEPLSNINVAQVYQWMQESSLLSMGSFLFNPSPGMKMHACDLARNLFMSPWVGDPLSEQEQQYRELWLKPIQGPCGNSPVQLDRVFRVLVDRHIPTGKISATEQKLIGITNMPAFSSQDLTGLLLYARVITLWDHFEDEKRELIEDLTQRQKSVAVQIMQLIGSIATELV